jgi:hypothetical protein
LNSEQQSPTYHVCDRIAYGGGWVTNSSSSREEVLSKRISTFCKMNAKKNALGWAEGDKAKLRSFGGGRLSAYRLLKSNRQGQPLAQVQLESVAFVALYCGIEERWVRSECGQESG